MVACAVSRELSSMSISLCSFWKGDASFQSCVMSGEVAQWLAPRTNREVGGSSLTVSTDDPLG